MQFYDVEVPDMKHPTKTVQLLQSKKIHLSDIEKLILLRCFIIGTIRNTIII